MPGVLGAVRLSRLVDDSTSPARQREVISAWASMHGKPVVHVTEDTDVSGRVPARERPELGPWLTNPSLAARWDTLVVAKLDRISRNLLDLCSLLDWCQDNGKVLVSITESLDMGTPHGRMVVQILGAVAEFERARIAERRREAADWLRRNGRWGGGVIPYGYDARELPGGGWELVPDPDQAEIIRWAADQVIAGRSVTALCEELTARGVPTSRGRGRWHNTSLSAILRSPILVGQVPIGDGVARDDDGVIIRRAAILPDETWAKLQAALSRATVARTGRRSSPLIGVLFCALCDSPVYLQRRSDRPTAFYHCRHCPARMIPAASVEELVHGALLQECGDVEMADELPVADRTAEVATVTEALEAMETQLVAGTVSADAWARATARLEARLKELTAETEVSEPELVLTGKTFAETWADLDTDGRRALLVANGIRAWAERIPDARVFGKDGTVSYRSVPHGDLEDGHLMWLPSRQLGLNVTVNLGRLHDLRARLATVRSA